jgi:rhamnose transport system permease protein
LSPFFLTPGNFSNLIAALMEVAIMALAMTLIIVAGEIDLSVESMAGLASAILGFLWAAGVPLTIASPLVLLVGALGGLVNGLLVARGGLPSLVVTLGTLALFRGLALIVLGPRGVSNFPPEFTELGFGHVPGTLIPWPFVIFLGLAAILAIVLHRTWIGRQIYAIGKNTGAARFSGVRVTRLKIGLFVLSGLIAALAGIILTSRLSSARADAGAGMTLTVVTVVLLGGVNIFGGRGTIPGVVLAVIAVAVMQNALRLASVTVEVQSIALGSLLILSVVIPTFAHQAKSAIDRVRRGRPPPADSVKGERAVS